MPQLEFSTFPSQIFWLAVSFSVLYMFVSRFVIPNIGAVVEYRATRVSEDISFSETMKVESEKLKSAYEKAIADARAQGMGMINTAVSDAEKYSNQMHKDLSRKTENLIEEADKRIEESKQKAISNLSPVVEEISSAIAAKLLSVDVNSDDVRKALSQLKAA